MKFEEKRVISRDDLARFFVDSAKKVLTDGKILVSNTEVILPESFEIELEYKEKKNRAKFELEIIWSLDQKQIPEIPGTKKAQIIPLNEDY